MIMRFPQGLRKALTLSYDDGVEQDIRLLNIMNAHGIKGTFNLNSGCYPPEDITWPTGQIHRRLPRSKAMDLYGKDGHEVAVHTLTHPSLTALPDSRVIYEIMADRENLEREFGGIITGAAYPYGTWNEHVIQLLRSCGIRYCRTVNRTHRFDIPSNWLQLDPTCHHKDPMLPELADRFLAEGGRFGSELFYLWGHAYEFEADNNWEVIERFCEKMGGRDDIWYATNIRICTYTEAWMKLEFSADGSLLHNPTDISLWFEDDRHELRMIAPGETIRL